MQSAYCVYVCHCRMGTNWILFYLIKKKYEHILNKKAAKTEM